MPNAKPSNRRKPVSKGIITTTSPIVALSDQLAFIDSYTRENLHRAIQPDLVASSVKRIAEACFNSGFPLSNTQLISILETESKHHASVIRSQCFASWVKEEPLVDYELTDQQAIDVLTHLMDTNPDADPSFDQLYDALNDIYPEIVKRFDG